MVLATHDLGEAQRCGYIVLLSHGQVPRERSSWGGGAEEVSASALIVSGPDAMNFADRLESPGGTGSPSVGQERPADRRGGRTQQGRSTDCRSWMPEQAGLLDARGRSTRHCP